MAALTEEQSILKNQAASWVEAELPVQKFREFRNSNSDGGFDPKATPPWLIWAGQASWCQKPMVALTLAI